MTRCRVSLDDLRGIVGLVAQDCRNPRASDQRGPTLDASGQCGSLVAGIPLLSAPELISDAAHLQD